MQPSQTVHETCHPAAPRALAEVIKRLQRRNLGYGDLNLASRHFQDAQTEAELAFDQLEDALAKACVPR